MRTWLSGFSVGFTVMGVVAVWYRSQLRTMQQQTGTDAFHDALLADMEAKWDDVPTDRKLRVYMKMAEEGLPLTEDDEETNDQPKKKRKNGKKSED